MAGCGWKWLEMLFNGQKQSVVTRNGLWKGVKWSEWVTGSQKWPKIPENE